MKAALCLLTLCLAGYVSSSQFAWQAGKQYTYGVQARLFSGVDIATQYAGIQVRYDIVVTTTGPNTLHLNPQNFRAVELNSNIHAGWRDGDLQDETPVEIPKKLLEYLESNMELELKNGVVDSIKVESHLPTWAVNIKKAQATHLTIDSTGANAVIKGNLNRQTNSVRPEEENQDSGFFYETMEETVHGECETYYTVSQNGPFDWPHQFQQQVQPGQKQQQQRNGQYNSNESNDNNSSNESHQRNSNENNSNQQDQQDNSSEERYNKYSSPQYSAYKRLVQRQDSESAEDSHESFQGEMPWPVEFANFCGQNDQVYEIIKTVNFTACKNKPVLGYSSQARLYGRAGDNNIGAALNRVLVSRYLACGKDRKQFTILKIEQEEQVNYGLRLEQNTVAGSIQNITLKSVAPAQRVEGLKKSKTINDLTYTFDPKEQQEQAEGKLKAAYFDVMEENDSSSSEEQYSTSTTTERYNQYQQQQQQQRRQQQQQQQQQQRQQQRHKSRKPRSVSSNEQNDSQQDSNSQESQEYNNEKQYTTNAEGQQVLRQPSLNFPPVNPMLVSPLQASGMKQRVETLMKEIVEDITTDNQPMAEAETLSKISTVAKILRYLQASDVEELYHKLAAKDQTEEDQTARSVFLDACAIAGTNPNMVTLFRLIKAGEIKGEQANQLVMSFPMYIRTPTKALIREFYNLVESTVVSQSLQLKTTAVLAFTNTLHHAYVNLRIRNSRYPVAQYGEFGNEGDLQQLYIPYLQKQLREYSQKEQSEGNNKHFTSVYLAALGNLGVKEIVPEVQQILDDSNDAYIKTKAILALSRVIVSRQNQNIPVGQIHGVDRNGQDALTDEVVEKQVLPLLMSVAFDRGEHPEVRMAAISLLLHTTNADVTVWQQLAYSTWFESSNEVRAFVYSSLKSLAHLDHNNVNAGNIHRRMQQKARAVLALAKPITPGYAKSRNSFSAGSAEHLQSSYVNQFEYFGSKDSNVPNYMFYKNHIHYGSNALSVSPLQFSLHGHTIQKLASFVLAQYRKQYSNGQNVNDQSAHKELDQIYSMLGIEQREQGEDIEGSLQIKFRDEMERIFSVNEDLIEELVQKAKKQGVQKLMSGIPINYQKTIHAAESVFEMPSLLGVPITFNFRMPVHFSARGNIRLVQEGSNFQDVQLQAEIHPVYAFKTHARLSFKVPFSGKKYQSGVQRHFVAELPFRALARKAQSGQYVLAITPSQLTKGAPGGPIQIATFHQKPYTIIVTDSLWPTTHKEGGQMSIVHTTQQPFKRQTQFGQRLAGLAFKTEEISEYREQNERNSGWVNFWQRFHSPSCFFQLGWLGGEKVRYVERKLVLDIQNSETKTIALIVAGKREQGASAKDLWQDSSSQSSQSTEESASSEQANDSSSQQQNSIESQENQSRQSSRQQKKQQQKRRQHGSASDSGASHSGEDLSQNGFIVAAAVIGKKTPIRPVQDGRAQIQKILQKGTPSTIQYLVQFSKSQGRVYIRGASGDAANEAAKSLPSTSNSLQALREAIISSPNTKSQPDGCAEFEGEYDAPKWANRGELVVLRKKLLSQDLYVKVKAELQFGQSCKNMPYEIKAQGKLERGPQMTEFAQSKSRQAQKCAEDEKKGFNASPVCLEVAVHQAAALNKGEFKIQFTQMPRQFQNRTDDVEDFAKALLYPYVSTDRFHEGAGDKKLKVEFLLTPNKEFLDVHITKPHSKLSFTSIRTNRVLRAALPFTATQSMANNIRDRAFRSDSDPFCSIEGNYVNTFDNVTYRFSEKSGQGCYHVLAQDCSQKHPVSVLVRDIATNEKKVVIYLGAKTKIELIPHEQNQQNRNQRVLGSNSKFHVHINEARSESLPRVIRSKSSGDVIARVEQMNEGGVQVFSKYFDVATNGKYVIVYASNPLRNRTCGVCGDFNGEKTADMKSPKNCPLSSGNALVASYAMKPQAVEQNEKGICRVDSQLKKQIQWENAQCQQQGSSDYNNYNGNGKQWQQQQQQQQSQRGNLPRGLNLGTPECEGALKSQVGATVYKFGKYAVKPLFWIPVDQRLQYSMDVKNAVQNKAGEIWNEGTVTLAAQMSADLITGKLNQIPEVGYILKKIMDEAARPLVVDGLTFDLDAVAKKSSCAARDAQLANRGDYDRTFNFQFAEEAGVEVDSEYVYLTPDEERSTKERKVALFLSRGISHIVHFNLYKIQSTGQGERDRLAIRLKDELLDKLPAVIVSRSSISDEVISCISRVLGKISFNADLYTLVTKTFVNKFCESKNICFEP